MTELLTKMLPEDYDTMFVQATVLFNTLFFSSVGLMPPTTENPFPEDPLLLERYVALYTALDKLFLTYGRDVLQQWALYHAAIGSSDGGERQFYHVLGIDFIDEDGVLIPTTEEGVIATAIKRGMLPFTDHR